MSKNNKNMYSTQQFLIKNGNPLYDYFSDLMFKSNNLYNTTNFHIRQLYSALQKLEQGSNIKDLHPLQLEVLDSFNQIIPDINKHLTSKFQRLIKEDIVKGKSSKRKINRYNMPNTNNKFVSYELLDAYFKHVKNPDYYELPAHCNQGVMKKVYDNWTSFFESIKKYKTNSDSFTGRPKPPRYKTKNTMNELYFSNQVCKIKDKKFLIFPKTKLKFNLSKHLLDKLDNSTLKQVRVQKWYNSIKLEVVLEEKVNITPREINTVMAIDLGVNNLATCVTSSGLKPLIIDGKPLKSISQYYNKQRSKYYSLLTQGKKPSAKELEENNYNFNKFVSTQKDSKKLSALDKKRFNKIKDYMHKCSYKIVEYVKTNNIDKVIVGYNTNWKDVDMNKSNKQSFKTIPFTMFIQQLEYKLAKIGVALELVEESYTSKASYLDNDTIPTYKKGDNTKYKFSGKRVKRGLYVSKQGVSINADVNGAANILSKHTEGIEIKLNHKILSCVSKYTPKQLVRKNKKSKKPFVTSKWIIDRCAICSTFN